MVDSWTTRGVSFFERRGERAAWHRNRTGAGRAYARIAKTVWFGSPALAGLPPVIDPGTPAGLALINQRVTRQATLVAYLDDFHVMMGLTLMLIP